MEAAKCDETKKKRLAHTTLSTGGKRSTFHSREEMSTLSNMQVPLTLSTFKPQYWVKIMHQHQLDSWRVDTEHDSSPSLEILWMFFILHHIQCLGAAILNSQTGKTGNESQSRSLPYKVGGRRAGTMAFVRQLSLPEATKKWKLE